MLIKKIKKDTFLLNNNGHLFLDKMYTTLRSQIVGVLLIDSFRAQNFQINPISLVV
jgi:hypothetical protein